MMSGVRGVVLLALLLGHAVPAAAQAQPPQMADGMRSVGVLIRDGRNLDANDLLQRLVHDAPPAERRSIYRAAGRMCVTLRDVDCARGVMAASIPFLETLPPSDVTGDDLLPMLFHELATGDRENAAKFLMPGVLARLAPAVGDPGLFAELQLLAAWHFRLASDFDAARDSVDRALVGTLSLTGDALLAPRLVIRIVSELLQTWDVERALRLFAAAEPMFRLIPHDGTLFFDLLQLRAQLLAYGRDYASASRELRLALDKLERLQIRDPLKASLRSWTYNHLIGFEVLRGDRAAALGLLQSHPLMAAKPDILRRGRFVDGQEFDFALAEEFVRLMAGDRTDAGWGELLALPPGWTKDPGQVRTVDAFGQAAAGLRLLRLGRKDEARRALEEAARKRLDLLQEQYRRSVYASPLPQWPDLVLMEFAVAATLASDAPDYDLVLRAHALQMRSVQTSADDALASQAVQSSDEGKRVAQSLRTAQVRQTAWETAQLAALARRLLEPDSRDPEARNPETAARDRQHILSTGGSFLARQHELRAAFVTGAGGNGVDSVASLAAVKQSLLPDEALVAHVTALGSLGRLCIRNDRTVSAVQRLDDGVFVDARLVVTALTAAHAPSDDADSRYPAAEAVRLGRLLLGGLEHCLRSSRRIYLVALDGVLGEVPPAALLADVPPARGAGFDLRAARWLVRDHAFVRTTSVGAFVASRRLSQVRRGTLDYLGIGDPVLVADGSRQEAVQAAARFSLPTRSGPLTSLPELPEAAEELQRVAGLFDKAKTRILTRDGASPEAFRLEPLSEFDIVHFATHGLVREEVPGLREPALVLTPDPRPDPSSDRSDARGVGLLTSSQIAALPLRARLVVLSACNTARYEPSIIDSGIQGLSVAFAVAGVPSMIASLWPIESALTRDLIVATFEAARGRHGDKDAAIADALAIAQRRHLDGSSPRPLLHPRFWAALIVLGDGSVKLDGFR